MADTRKDKRTPVSLKVRFKSATVDEFIEQYSRDLSRGGIFIKSKQPMPVGTLLKFEMQLKDESPLIHGVGRVVWKREAGEGSNTEAPSGMGIKFIRMEPECRALVERIVAKRGDGPGQYEAGGGDAEEPAKNAENTFFPTEGPKESDLPAPEDRTQVRHANEFLASALAEAGSAEVASEAEKKAEETRRRAEERVRAAEAKATVQSKRPPALSPDEEETMAADENTTVARPRPGGLEAALAAEAAEAAAAEEATAARPAPSEPAPAPAPSKDSTAAVEAAPTPAAAKPVEPVVVPPAAPVHSSSKKHGKKKKRPGTPPPPELVGLDTSAKPPMEENSRSFAIPAMIGVAALIGIGALAASSMGGGHEEREVAQEQPETEAAPAPEPVDAGPPAPPPVMATVAVETSPEGAQILVANEARGLAPIEIELPVDTATEVIARMQGYVNASQEVTLTEGEEHEPIQLELSEMPYVVAVTTSPPGARVRVAGRGFAARTGTTDDEGNARIELPRRPTSALQVTAVLRGHQNASISVEAESFSAEEEGEAMVAPVSLELEERATRSASSSTPRPRPQPAQPSSAPQARPSSGGTSSGSGGTSSGSSGGSTSRPAPTPTPTPPPTVEALPDNPF